MANKWSKSPLQSGLASVVSDFGRTSTRLDHVRPDPIHLPVSDWRPPRAADLAHWGRDARRICVDVECRDPLLTSKGYGPGVRRDPTQNYVCGVAVAVEDGPEYYLPIRHEGGDNCDFDVWDYLAGELRSFNGDLVLNGGQYDLDWCEDPLLKRGASLLENDRIKIKDVQVLDCLLWELHYTYNLDAICGRRELPGKDETLLRQVAQVYRADPKADIWRFPARYVAPYGIVDARRPLQVLRRQEAEIPSTGDHRRPDGIKQVWELEQSVTPICVKMRRRGLRVDVDQLEAVERLTLVKEAEHLDELHSYTGVRVAVGDTMKTAALVPALQKAGFTIPKTPIGVSAKTGRETGGNDSVDEDFLKKCGKVGKAILRARKWSRLRTTNVHEVKRALIRHGEGDWRVHVTFNQTRGTSEDDETKGKGVRYGRFSSTDYNIQAQSGRDDEFGELWRSVYVADNGKRWACSDWSQQEPRIGVHFAEILGLEGAREFADAYRANPALDIHQRLTDIINNPVDFPRKQVKNTVNGRLYGMGDTKLCWECGWETEWRVTSWSEGRSVECPTAESQKKIEIFNKFAPWLTQLTRAAAKAAEKYGHVWTVLGRRCNFERGPDGKIWKAHKAFNRIGQGSAADQMKATLVACDREGIPIQMVVHDELDWSWTDPREVYRVRELQMTVVKFAVPMKVDAEVGLNWGKLEKIEKTEWAM